MKCLATGVAGIGAGNGGVVSQFVAAKSSGTSALLSCVNGNVRHGPGRSSPCLWLCLGGVFEFKFAPTGLFEVLLFS